MNTTKLLAATAAIAITTSVALPMAANADTLYWTGSASSTWGGSDLNWTNSSGTAIDWVDGSDAIFPATTGSSSTSITPSGTPIAHDATFNGKYTISTSSFGATGKISSFGASLTIARCLAGDSVRLGGISPIYLGKDGTASLKTIYLEDTVTVYPSGLNAFGPNPSSPATNIVAAGGSPSLVANASGDITLGVNRIVRIADGCAFTIGAPSGKTFTFSGPIVADASQEAGLPTGTSLTIPSDQAGLVVFAPNANVTNTVGRLAVRSNLKLSGGTTLVSSSEDNKTGANAPLYVCGDGRAFEGKGNLLVDGVTLLAPQSKRYVDVSNFGQVIVTNGGSVFMPGVHWLNGMSGPGRLVVADGGVFKVATLRVSNSTGKSEVLLGEGGTMCVENLYMWADRTAEFAFDGGVFQKTGDDALFIGTDDKWTNVVFSVGAKGAVFDCTNGKDVIWSQPLVSGVSGGTDGGITVLGADPTVCVTFSGAATNSAWTGTTVISNATVRFASARTLASTIEICGDATGCGRIAVATGQDISGMTLTQGGIDSLDADAAPSTYKILEAPDGFTGKFALAAGFPKEKWSVRYNATGAWLSPVKATTIIMR